MGGDRPVNPVWRAKVTENMSVMSEELNSPLGVFNSFVRPNLQFFSLYT
jgi:hypothetical protein